MPAAERDHDGFLFNFPPDAEEARREEARSRIAILCGRKKRREEEGEGRKGDRGIDGRVTEIRDAATGRRPFDNSDDVPGDACFEMSAANSLRAAIRLAHVSPLLIAG